MKLTRLDSLQIKADDTASTTEPKFTVSYRDTEFPDGEQLPGSNQGSLTGATAVTAAAAPSADRVEREITGISVYNADTVERTITIIKDHNGTDYEVVAMAVPAGRSLIYDGSKYFESYEADSGDSKATSNSVVISTNLSLANSKSASAVTISDSKAASNSVLASTADSKGASAGTQGTTADSKALSVSVLTSTADSKAVSNSVVISSNLVTSDSKAASNSVIISTIQSKLASGGQAGF